MRLKTSNIQTGPAQNWLLAGIINALAVMALLSCLIPVGTETQGGSKNPPTYSGAAVIGAMHRA